MSSTFETTAFERATEPVLRLTREQTETLVGYRGDGELQARIEELATKSKEWELTVVERAEYEGYVKANKFIAILQAKARKLLAGA
jgi:hypothetical protein